MTSVEKEFEIAKQVVLVYDRRQGRKGLREIPDMGLQEGK
jgi:hypothetical protein